MKISKLFFSRKADEVAHDLIGKVLVVVVNGEELRSKIVESEAYFGEDDPASWARLGKRKDNQNMWEEGGTILIKNVHKYYMLNFVTGEKGEAQAVLIRAVEPLNYEGNCCGPGLLTLTLGIDKNFNGKNIFDLKEMWIEEEKFNGMIERSNRIGVVKDLKQHYRFYLKGNKCVSKARWTKKN